MEQGITVLIVTHDMEQVYAYCDDVCVIQDGKCYLHKEVHEFFESGTCCKELDILPPAYVRMKDALKEAGFDVKGAEDMQSLATVVAKQVKHHG